MNTWGTSSATTLIEPSLSRGVLTGLAWQTSGTVSSVPLAGGWYQYAGVLQPAEHRIGIEGVQRAGPEEIGDLLERASRPAQVGDPAALATAAAMRSREAERKARACLDRHLTEEQRHELREHQRISVPVGDKVLVIPVTGLVREMDAQGRHVADLCIHPSASMPRSDDLLTLLLYARHDPDTFLSTANRTLRPPRPA